MEVKLALGTKALVKVLLGAKVSICLHKMKSGYIRNEVNIYLVNSNVDYYREKMVR
jgi:hypothetical protein